VDHRQLLLTETRTVRKAMEILDKTGRRVLFLVRDEVLVASLSDGDIRRWILSGGSLKAPVSKAANYAPCYLPVAEQAAARELMRRKSIQALPLVDGEGHVVSICFWDDHQPKPMGEPIDAPVVMMAGGLGTRLYPYTKILPKPLIPIGDIPIAERIIRNFRQYGCKTFYLVVNHKKNMIKAYFNEIERDYTVEYADEEEPLGTGGGLGLLKGRLDTTFILTNCDILIHEDIAAIYRHHKQEQNTVTMICSLRNVGIPYGVVEIGGDGSIAGMREKPSLSFFTNTGCYIVEPEVLEHIEEGKAIGFPDVIQRLKDKGLKVGVYPIGENAWLDMGQMDALEKMKEQLGLD